MIKKVIVGVLICILALPFFVCAQSFNSYDEYGSVFPPVRDQDGHSDCWSFAATGAVEHSMAVKDGADFSGEGKLFSEWHMAAAMNITEDKLFEKYTRSHNEGGNRAGAVAYLARSFSSGPVKYDDYNKNAYEMYLADKRQYKMLTLKSKQATLTKATFLTDRDEGSSFAAYDAKTEKLTYGRNEAVIEKIKAAVKKYGAVAVSYYAYERDEETYFNKETGAYCALWEDYIYKRTPDGNAVKFKDNEYRFEKASNHAVLIVGWDDNYPHTSFKETPVSFDGESYKAEDGAWIVKNSWGTDFGKDGIEYISYMEPTICQYATVYDMEYTRKYDAVTHTDKGLMGSVRFPEVGYGVCGVNRFDKEGLINAVGLYVCDSTPSVEILIDTNAEEDLKRFTKAQFEKRRATLVDAESGEEADFIRIEEGYHLIRLKEPVYSSGRFDIYVKYTVDEKSDIVLPTGNNIGTDESYVPCVTYWAYITGNGHVHEWKSIDANWCVNAFMADADFDLVKAKTERGKATLELLRYKADATCRVMAVFYKGDEVLAKKSYTPAFDEYGRWKINENIDGVTKVKAIVWQQNKRVI